MAIRKNKNKIYYNLGIECAIKLAGSQAEVARMLKTSRQRVNLLLHTIRPREDNVQLLCNVFPQIPRYKFLNVRWERKDDISKEKSEE